MRHAEHIAFVADEDGWEMHVTDELGEVFRFNVHGVAWDLPDLVRESIGAWRAEGEAVRSSASAGDDLQSGEGDCYPPGSLGALLDSGALDEVRDRERGK